MKKIYYIIFLSFILFSLGINVQSQCLAEIETDPPNGSQNLSVQFYGNGIASGGAFYACDDPALPTGWTSTPFDIGAPCISPTTYPALDATDYLWIGARDLSGYRYIETNDLDIASGGSLSFEIRYGVTDLGSDCRGPNSTMQGVALEYSTDGGSNWNRMTYYLPLSTDTIFTNWNQFIYTVPGPAQTSSTRFRWFQEFSSNDLTDKWGLNNISIESNITVDTYSWDFGDGSPLDNNKDPLHTFPDYGAYDVSLSITTSQPCSDQKDTIIYINSAPTIDNIVELDVNSTDLSSDLQLTGISDGGIGGQTLTLSAISSNPTSLVIESVTYTSPETLGTITVAPDSTMCGDATITATVEYTNLKTISYDELFTVHVLDKTLPVFGSCPTDIVANILPGKCDSIITYLTPTAIDNCPGAIVVQTEGLPSGSLFPTGTTINTFVVTDASGNQARCSFTVTITETIPPTITCPTDIVAAECNNTLTIAAPVAFDACGIESVENNSPYATSYTDASGTYPVGVTTITWTVTDLSGNTATCDQRVEITANPVQPIAPDINLNYGETALLTATPDTDHFIRWYENSDLSDIPLESSTLDLGFLTPETYYRYASQVSTITGCEGMARPVAAIVDKAELTVTARDTFRTYLDMNPPFFYSYSGFVFSEDQSVINEDPTIFSTADENTDAGTYAIEFTGGYDNNYSFLFINGVLTINKADHTLTFENVPDDLRVTETHTLVGTATSGLPVVFVPSDPTMLLVEGDLMTVLKEGNVTISARNDGNINYNAAPDVDQLISTLPSFDNSKSLFTPNSDGINDYWYLPFIADMGSVSVKVYNRHGKLVYESSAYANDWDGTTNGTPLPEGAYYYIIDSENNGVIKGVVNIVR